MSLLLVLASLLVQPVMLDDTIKFEVKDAVFDPKDSSDLLGYNEGEEKAFYYINGSATVTGKAPADGEYTLTLSASCTAAQNENAKITVKVGDKEVAKDFLLKSEDQKDYEFTVKVSAGEVKVKVTFTNDVHKDGEYDRNFYLHGVTLKKK